MNQEQKESMKRRKIARRQYKKKPVFAVENMKVYYPGYTSEMLFKDLPLKRRPKAHRRKKRKPFTDFRRCQMEKYAAKLRHPLTTAEEYNHICVYLPILEAAHRGKENIELLVNAEGEKKIYSFGWNTREGYIKSFITYANKKGVTHEELEKKKKSMQGLIPN